MAVLWFTSVGRLSQAEAETDDLELGDRLCG